MKGDPVVTVYITKYALTQGIIKTEAELSVVNGVTYASRRERDGYVFTTEYALTEEAAIAKAEKMRTRKLVALKKQVAKLANLDIKVVTR